MLQNLLIEDTNRITLSLVSNLRALRQILDQTMDYNFAALFVKVIGKSLQSSSLKENNNHILSILLHSKFLLNISKLLVKINYSSEAHVEFLLNLMYILKIILIQNPSEYLNTLQIIGVIGIILKDPDQIRVENMGDLMEKYKDLQHLSQKVIEKKRNPETVVSGLPGSPPNDFRDLEMVLTAEAIHSKETVFLRKNIVKGAYDNVDHYLDVQFRLLREDFFGPFRDGIKQYLSLKNKQEHQHIDNLRIYDQVHILYSLCTLNGIAHKVSFNVSQLQVNWNQSKRLLYGSLVCLTSDDFQTVYFATVIGRTPGELKKGMVELLFFSSCEDIAHLSSSTLFIMAETTAYFEAYRPILTALKQVQNDDIPFQDYIIHGKSQVKPPNYFIQQKHMQMDFTCLSEDCQLVFNPNQNVVSIKESLKSNLSLNILQNPWPDAEVLKLNHSQNQALQNALTKEFSLTQGPPGTGKTYIGLKIVKILCSNSNLWRMNGKNPMLIICYTNQALDKFLEGIANFLEGGILRVGGRSKSEVLRKYLLKNIRRTYRLNNCFNIEFMENRYLTINQLRALKSEIDQISNKIRLTKQGILHENLLKNHMGQFYDWLIESYQDNFSSKTNRNIPVMTQWLGYGNVEILDEPNVHKEVEADYKQELSNIEDEVDVHTDADAEDFSILETIDDEFLALNIADIDNEEKSVNHGFQRSKQEIKKLKKQLHRDLNSNTLLKDEEIDQIRYHDMWTMKKEKRWELYRRWVDSFCQQVRDEILQKEVEYNHISQAHKEILQYEDGEIMKDSLIIGMTTTSAAKYRALLQEIQPKIIIVEEAAEILESHVITALNPMCEQLILIGDHRQLRPNVNVYELARNYNFEVSLFERMVLNKCHIECLSHQHRMRPEISQLLRPIYSELHDHPSVTRYENVKGIVSNVYFIQHNEAEMTNIDANSYSNPHEASFLVELCNYILKQGYCQSQVTILTTYTAQLFQLRQLMSNKQLESVRVAAIDNYQGEENDIILLSLVRNNEHKKIGFLKINNRVCVALSRAKIGFYVIGNFEILSQKSKLWKNILLLLKSQKLVGYALTLCCPNHPDQRYKVRNESDFAHAPEGGCFKPCETRLKCGHSCKRLCHPIDDHNNYKCLEKCVKIAPGCLNNHKCTQICSEKCTPCTKIVSKIMPGCNHRQKMACTEIPITVKCKNPCKKRLSCGHQCMESCGDVCTIECRVNSFKTYPCDHALMSPCFLKAAVCQEVCSKRLDCGHECSGFCSKCSDRRIHSICSQGCQKLLECGLKCVNKQCSACSPCRKSCENRCVHQKCTRSCEELCALCYKPCEWRCEHYKCNRYCYESCDRPKCDRPCQKILPCNHPCVGLCGEKCPHLCRVCNKKELTETFFGTEDAEDARFVELEDCGHIFEKSGLDQWMSEEMDSPIHFKVCPKCKIPIRHNFRYGHIINKILMDINMVKKISIENIQQIDEQILQIRTVLDKLPQHYRDYLQDEWRQSQNGYSTLCYWATFRFRIELISFLCEIMENDILKDDSSFQNHCTDLSKWFLRHKEMFSKGQMKEIETEMKRIFTFLRFHEARKKNVTTIGEYPLKIMIDVGLLLLTAENYSSIQDELLPLQKKISETIPEILQKKPEIVWTNGVFPGHWYNCPKGIFSLSILYNNTLHYFSYQKILLFKSYKSFLSMFLSLLFHCQSKDVFMIK